MLTTNHVPTLTLTLTLTLLLPYVASGRGLSRTRTLTVALIIVLPFLAFDRAIRREREVMSGLPVSSLLTQALTRFPHMPLVARNWASG